MTVLFKKARSKPPSFLIFCGDKDGLYNEIRTVLRQILPIDTYTIAELTKRALLDHPWMQYCACLLIADTNGLDPPSCARFNAYLMRNPSKILFAAKNLSEALIRQEEADLMRSAFGVDSQIAHLFAGQGTRSFINEKIAFMAKNEAINEITFTPDLLPKELGDFNIRIFKEKAQPLCLQLDHPSHERKLLLSDSPINQLLKNGNYSTLPPIQDLLTRLGIDVVSSASNGTPIAQQPQLTGGFLFTNPDKAILNMTGMTYGKELGTKPKLLFCPTANLINSSNESDSFDSGANADLLPVEVRRRKEQLPAGISRKFDVDRYYGKMQSKHFGQALLFVPVCTSTMDVSDSIANAFPSIDGTLVVAGHQTAGRGRIGNEWLCAEGAAMFNVNLNVAYASELGRHICLLQHLMAVSICHVVSELAPHFPIKIKWPNDLYYGRLSKIGGVLVRTSQNEADQRYSCLIGIGLNIANSKPTVCINDLLPEGATKLNIEETLALVMSKFEAHLANFQEKGKAELVRDYYKFWLHTDEEVSILCPEDGSHEKVVIRGLDEDGYLLVRSKQSGKHISLMSDGNSFDLFQGLIIPKSM